MLNSQTRKQDMDTKHLSRDALTFWMAYFLSKGNCLEFGGEQSKGEITDKGRAALEELVRIGAVENATPAGNWRGRELFKSTGLDLRNECKARDMHPSDNTELFVMFRNTCLPEQEPAI
jgi:hypothetical protein